MKLRLITLESDRSQYEAMLDPIGRSFRSTDLSAQTEEPHALSLDPPPLLASLSWVAQRKTYTAADGILTLEDAQESVLAYLPLAGTLYSARTSVPAGSAPGGRDVVQAFEEYYKTSLLDKRRFGQVHVPLPGRSTFLTGLVADGPDESIVTYVGVRGEQLRVISISNRNDADDSERSAKSPSRRKLVARLPDGARRCDLVHRDQPAHEHLQIEACQIHALGQGDVYVPAGRGRAREI